MVVVVTRNAPDRMRGFLASCMCEIAPGVYTAPRLNRSVRERVWATLVDWWEPASDVAIVMTWSDSSLPGGQVVATVGTPRTDVVEYQGIFLPCRPAPAG